MDKINGVSQIVKILQSQIGKNKEKSRTGKSSTNKKNDIKAALTPSIKDLEIQIATKISLLDKKSQNYKQSAVNIFIDEILHWEFSAEITSDPEFTKLKEKISTTFNENKSLNKDFDKILNSLER